MRILKVERISQISDGFGKENWAMGEFSRIFSFDSLEGFVIIVFSESLCHLQWLAQHPECVKYWIFVWMYVCIYLCIRTQKEKAVAPHSSTLAWKIPWTEEPGGLQSIGSWTVGHDWATSLSRFTFMHWRRKWQPTPVFLPGESQGWGSMVGCRLWGRTDPDTAEVT